MEDRELYEKKQKARLDEWQAEIDKLKAKTQQASADAQIRLKSRLEDLDRKIDEGRSKLSDLADAGQEKWDAARERMDTMLEAVQVGVRETRSELEEKD